MEALGRLFNIVPTADGVEVALKQASGVTFVCVGADGAQTFTVAEATDAAGTGAQTLAAIDHYYHNTSAAGAAAWTKVDPGAATGVITPAASVAVINIDATSLSDGFDYVRCTSSGAALVYAIVHDLVVQRSPVNLPAAAV